MFNSFRMKRKGSFDSLSRLSPNHVRRIILGSPVPSSTKVNISETHGLAKSLDSKDKERHKVESLRTSILTPPSTSHKSQDKLLVEDSEWDEELETYLSSDTIDTDELEAEIKRQKRKKNKKDKKHKRNRNSKKRKKKRNKSLSSIELISDNDLDDVLDTNAALKHYTPPAEGVLAAKSPSDPTYTPIKQHSPRSSDTPPPIRPGSRNSYYSESTNMTAQAGVSSSSSTAQANNNIVGLQVTVTNRMSNTRHRTPPRTSNAKNRFPNAHSPHTPPYVGSSASTSSRDVRSSRFILSPGKEEHRHHHHHHGRPDIATTPANHHYHQRQTAAVNSDSHKYKDTDRYYHHQPSTPPHKKRKIHDIRHAANSQSYYDHGRHDSKSNSRNMRTNEYDRYNRNNYTKRYSRYVGERSLENQIFG